MMDESTKVPPGFHFSPFEEELISLYLKPKVLGQKIPSNIIEERQLYGPNANPWQLFHPENHSWILSEVSPGKFEKITYVFVNLTRRATAEGKNKSKREYYNKKAGCGTWDGQTKRTEIRDSSNGDLIGERRMLSFEINEVCDQDFSKVGYWRMHEYHLCGVNKDIINPCNTVLCKITLDSSKNPPVKLRYKCNQDHSIKTSTKPDKTNTNQGVSQGDKGKGTENVETSDGVECVNSSYVEEDTAVIVTSPSEKVKTGYLNPSISDFHWPVKKIKMEGGGGDLDLDMSGYLKPKEEQPDEDTTEN